MWQKIKRVVGEEMKKNVRFDKIDEHSFIDNFNGNPVIVDLGASNGAFSNAVIKKYPSATLILIEANPFLIEGLKNLFKGNTNVQIINAAIGGEHKDKVEFYISKNVRASSINKSISESFGLQDAGEKVAVEMVTLKDIMSRFGLKRINLLKVDVEGMEVDLINSLEAAELDLIDQISIEFHDFIDPSLGPKVPQCIKKLKDRNYGLSAEGTAYMHGSKYYNCLFYKKTLKSRIIIFKRSAGNFCKLLSRLGKRSFNKISYTLSLKSAP